MILNKSNWVERSESLIFEWELTNVVWMKGVSTARVAFCDSPFGPSVLKVGIYDSNVGPESRALVHFGDKICPILYKVSTERNALLIERLETAGDLATLYPAAHREIEIWTSLYRSITSRPHADLDFPKLSDYAKVFHAVEKVSPSAAVTSLLKAAHNEQDILMGPRDDQRVLHGDMHHFNILLNSACQTRLIDPHGVVGNPLYEIGAFLRNPMTRFYHDPGLEDRALERIGILASSMSSPREVVSLMGFYGVVFSLAWDLDEGATTVDENLVQLGQLYLDESK